MNIGFLGKRNIGKIYSFSLSSLDHKHSFIDILVSNPIWLRVYSLPPPYLTQFDLNGIFQSVFTFFYFSFCSIKDHPLLFVVLVLLSTGSKTDMNWLYSFVVMQQMPCFSTLDFLATVHPFFLFFLSLSCIESYFCFFLYFVI